MVVWFLSMISDDLVFISYKTWPHNILIRYQNQTKRPPLKAAMVVSCDGEEERHPRQSHSNLRTSVLALTPPHARLAF